MSNLWDDIARTIREGVDTVVEKTEELTKIGKIKVDIINIKRNVEKNFSELGGKVYHLIVEESKTKVAAQKEVKEIIECVKILEQELQEKNLELKKIKSKENGQAKSETAAKATSATKAAASATKAKPKARPRTQAKGKTTPAAKSSAGKAKQKAST